MHGPEHARDKLVDTITLGDERYQSRDAALVVSDAPEVGEDELLELVDLVLQVHQVGDGFVAFVGIINRLEADVFLVLEGAIESRMLLVECQLGQEEVDILADQGPVSAHALAGYPAF